MKRILLTLLIFPGILIAQQVGTVKPPASVSISNPDISSLNSQIVALTNQLKEVSEAIKQARTQLSALVSSRNNINGQIADKKAELSRLNQNADNYATEKSRFEKEIADLNKKLDQVNSQIAAQQNTIDKQAREIENLQSVIDQQKKKVDELEAREQQSKESKKTDSLLDEQAEAFALVSIINDSLPVALNGLTVSEKTVINGFKTRFNNDSAFRSRTLNYIKLANANNYFSKINKAGPVAERNSRFLIAARQELAILSKN